MTALPQDAVADLQQRIAELERQLETAVHERDAAIERQTASALVNFRLKNELRAVTDRQKAGAEILDAIANTHGDAGHALQRIAETTQHFFNSASVTIRIAEGDQWIQTVRVGSSGHLTGAQPTSDSTAAGTNLPATVYRQNRQIHIPDLDNVDPSMADWPVRTARAAGIRTVCATPLRRDGKPLGALIVYRDRLAPFTDDELALQQSFADQAVIAIENARLFNATKEALERQTATADILKVIAHSPSDVQPVFDAIAESANRLIGGFSSTVILFVDGMAHLRAFTPTTLEADAILQSTFPRPVADFPPVRRAEVGEIDQITDTESAAADNELRTIARARGYRSVVFAPLTNNGTLIGLIGVTRIQPGPFAEHHLQLLQTFSNQALIAIENTRLFSETQEALEHQKASANILGAISNSVANAQPVFEEILRSLAHLFGADERSILLVGDDGLLHVGAMHGPNAEQLRALFPRPLAGSVTEVAMRENRRIIQYTDVFDDPEVPPGLRDFARLYGKNYSLVAVPLIWEERVIGSILVGRISMAPFAEKECALIRTFADQAVIAIQNARLFNETKEALERQTTTADILKVIASSPSDVQPVFDAIVGSAKRLLGGFTAAVFRLIDENVHLAAYTPTNPAADEALKADFPQPVENFEAFRLAQHGKPFPIPDTEEVLHQPLRDIARLHGFRSMLWVPITNSGKTIGIISVTRAEPGAFAPHHIQLLQTFADQAVIAIENTRLFTETQEALERQTATADILKVIASSPSDVQPVFDAIASSSKQLIGGFSATVFRFVDGIVNLAAYTPVSPAADEFLKTSFPRPTANLPFFELAKGGKVVQEADSEANPDAALRDVARARGFRSSLFSPLMSKGTPIGLIVVTRKEPGVFAAHHVQLLETFADQAVIAIENARLFNETREALERQTATADILKVIASSPSDVQPVFEAIVGSAAQLFEPCAATMTTLKDDKLHWNAAAGSIEGFDVERTRTVYPIPFDLERAPSARAILERRIIEIPDIESPDTPEFTRKAAVAGGFRSITFVPLIDQEQGIGTIIFTHPQAGHRFSERQLALMQTFADQAVIAIQNTRLFNETKEALERQTATADILKVIASSPSDVQPVFEAIAASANRLIGGFSTAVFRFIDGVAHLTAFTPTTSEADEVLRSHFPRPVDDFEAAELAQQGRPVVVPDTEEATDQRITDIGRARGFSSMLFVPLMNSGVPTGLISVTRAAVGSFATHHVQLLQTFADQAVIAIQNTRLFNETQEALERQTATAEILKVIASSPSDVQPVFEAILARALHLCEAAFGFLTTYDGERYELGAQLGVPSALAEHFRDGMDEPRPGDAHWRLLEGEDIINGLDQKDEEAYRSGNPLRRAVVDLGGARSALVVALRKGGALRGSITIYRKEVRPFSTSQTELLRHFADQAVIAIENTRLFNEVEARTVELTEALEQQTATAEVLGVISSSAGDLAPVFDAMLGKAMQLCGANFGVLNTYDGKAFHTAATYGLPSAYDEYRRSRPLEYGPGTGVYRLLRGEAFVELDDLRGSEAYVRGDPNRRALVDLGGARCLLAVPLLKDEHLAGTVMIFRQEKRPFSEKQIALLQQFAAQAVIAIENTRLLRELRESTEDLTESLQQQTATSEVLQIISSSPGDLRPVFDKMLENATRVCGAEFGSMLLAEDGGFRQAALYNPPAALAAARTGKVLHHHPLSAPATAIRSRQVVQIEDVRASEAYQLRSPATVEIAELGGARTIAVVPMLRDDQAIGSITVYRQEVRLFSEKQIELLTNFARQAVIAIENARLLRELRQRTDDLTESLQFQTASADVLKVISRSPDALQPVLDAIVETSRELCGSDGATIFLLRDEKFHLTAVSGDAILPSHLQHMRSNPVALGQPGSLLSRVVREKRSSHIPNVMDDPELRDGTAGVGGARALLAAPLIRDGEAVGVIILRQSHLKPFTSRQIQAIETFADQAVIAISNVNLFEQVQARTRDLTESLQFQTASAEVLKVISRSPDTLQPVLDVIVETSRELCGCDATTIFLLRDERFHVVAISGSLPTHLEYMKANPHSVTEPGSTLSRVYQQKCTLHYPNVMDDPELSQGASGRGGARALLNVPLMSEGEVIGIITLRNSVLRPFTARQIQAVETFADQAVIAISNVSLFDEVQQRTRELSKSLDDLRTAQDRLIQTEKLASLGQLTAGIAHEIKNPLNFVNNFAALSAELTDELKDSLKPAKFDETIRAEVDEITGLLKDNLAKVVQHGKRADSIVKNMLLHSREGSGEHRPADVNALVDESLNLAYHGARAEKPQFNVTLQRDFDPQAGQVEVFPQEITRVLLNLISNGFYAVTKRKADNGAAEFEPLVTATTRGAADHVEIRIRDNGTGIPPEVKEKMFNPFFTTKPAGEGTGLGLSMSHDIIVKQHGGTIEVETEPGAFTEFRLVLPRTSLARSNGNR